MSTTNKADVAKNHQILKALVKQQGNNHCADCKTATHPRWASWNLGMFICIRCSGIHRSMGTHISRVKSVDLDSWTNEQTESMLRWGNVKGNTFWEAQLPGEPGTYTPDDSKIENFIKTKYDLKKWAASKTIPNPSDITVNGVSQQTHSVSTHSQAQAQAQGQDPAPRTTQRPQHNQSKFENNKLNNTGLLDLKFGAPVSSLANNSSNFAKPSPPAQQQHISHQQKQQSQQPQQQTNGRPDLKKSILSLYSTPHASNSTPNFPIRSTNTPLQYNNNHNATTNSLNGLNFNNGSSNSSINTSTSSNQWSNTSSIPRAQPQQGSAFTTGNSRLDDDLFKNHWN